MMLKSGQMEYLCVPYKEILFHISLAFSSGKEGVGG